MNKNRFQKSVAMAFSLTLAAVMTGNALAARPMHPLISPNPTATQTEETVTQNEQEVKKMNPDSVLYYGRILEIKKDKDGNMTRLVMDSERYGEYVMNISDETVFVDSGLVTGYDKNLLQQGDALYVFHSGAVTLSMPPQSAALAVVANIPQDAGSAIYLKVDTVEPKDGVITVTANNGTETFVMTENTRFSPYLTKNIVRPSDVREESRIMVWFDANPNLTEKTAYQVMLLPDNTTYITRGAFASALYELAGEPTFESDKDNGFTDLAKDDENKTAILWAVESGYLTGYGEGLFGADDVLTLEQMVTVAWRFRNKPMLMDYPGLTAYADAKDMSQYALPALSWAHQQKLIGTNDRPSEDGKLYLEPQAPVSEKAAARFLQAFGENL